MRFEVQIENLASLADVRVSLVLDGITYRAELLGADSRSYRGRLVEPFEQAFRSELPLFVLGMSSYRYVREGKATGFLWKAIQGELERIHRRARLKADLDAARALCPGHLEARAQDAQARRQRLEGELDRLRGRLRPLAQELKDRVSRMRREIQKSVKAGWISHCDSLDLLRDQALMEATVAAEAGEVDGKCRVLRSEIQDVEQEICRLEDDFKAETGFALEEVLRHLDRA